MNTMMMFCAFGLGISSICFAADRQGFFEQVSLDLEDELCKVLTLDEKITFLEGEIAVLQEMKELCTNQSWNAYESFKESKENSRRTWYEKRQRSSLETQWMLDIYTTKLKYVKMMRALDSANRKAKAVQ
ncbi:hypothetical protein KBD08_02350 [Candidatus Babeliales bacterium]|nr:hypothetical protein [Candidatus Babeliales bacterium]